MCHCAPGAGHVTAGEGELALRARSYYARLALRARFLLRRSRCALAFPARAARLRHAALALRARISFIQHFILKTVVVRKRFQFLKEHSNTMVQLYIQNIQNFGSDIIFKNSRLYTHARSQNMNFNLVAIALGQPCLTRTSRSTASSLLALRARLYKEA